jgi:hypothetical protein
MPAAITKRGSFLCGADDVSEENGRKHTIDFDRRTRPGQKLLNCISNFVAIVTEPRWVVFSWELDSSLRLRNC